jgi:hypothetical protein
VRTLQMMARHLTTFGVLMLLAVSSANGQAVALHANVPFAFELGGKSIPAGSYKIEVLGSRYVQISTPKELVVKLPIITQLGGNRLFGDASLVFDEFEGHHLLSEVWIPGVRKGDFRTQLCPLSRAKWQRQCGG